MTIEQHEGIDMGPCPHEHVERDDDGLNGRWYVCLDCDQTVAPERDEDGFTDWVVIE